MKRNRIMPGARGLRRTLLGTAMSLAIACLALVGTPQAASAGTSSGCAGIMPYTCVYVTSDGGWARSVSMVHVNGLPQHCNYAGRFWFYSQSGSQIGGTVYSGNPGCAYGPRPYVAVNNSDRYMPRGKVCGQWYYNGSAAGGRACAGVPSL
jgi:hypothetical protein